MARFDVYVNPEGAGYLLEVQADLFDNLNSRVVVPLMLLAVAPMPARTLNPVFAIEGEEVVMVTQFMAAVPSSMLRGPVATLAHRHEEIVSAIDLLLQGF